MFNTLLLNYNQMQKFIDQYNKSVNSSIHNFEIFYENILVTLITDKNLISDIIFVLKTLIKRIKLVDDLIDKEKVELYSAINIIFPENKLNTNIHKKKTKNKLVIQYNNKIEEAEKLKKLCNKIIINRFETTFSFDHIVSGNLDEIYKYGESEKRSKNEGIVNYNSIEQLLFDYNCDFNLYTSIIFKLFLKEIEIVDKKALVAFLKHYLLIDGILDSFCDLFDDINDSTFNVLLSKLKATKEINKTVEKHNIRQILFSSEIYNFFYEMAEKNYLKAIENLELIKNTQLKEKLYLYINGAIEGFRIAKDNDFFAYSNASFTSDLEKVLYKPYPWEIVNGKMLLKDFHNKLSKLKKKISAFNLKTFNPNRNHLKDINQYYRKNYKSIDKQIILLETRGCTKYTLKKDKCSHCGINQYVIFNNNQKELLNNFKQKFDYVSTQISRIGIYCIGSFFDDNEIVESTRISIYQYIKEKGFKKSIFLETRPEFIDEYKIQSLKNILNTNEVIIGLGFDQHSDIMRNIILNKDISKIEIEKSIQVLKKYNVKSMVYICLKPPFLNENESIVEAVTTGKYLQEIGADIVSIESLAIQYNTLQYHLRNQSQYQLPWLWSSIEVAKSLINIIPVMIGGFVFYPAPLDTAKNCKKCTNRIKTKFVLFNKTQDINILLKENCTCKKEWKKTLRSEKISYELKVELG